MRILLITGTQTEDLVRRAASESGHDCVVEVIGEVASFISPRHLIDLIQSSHYDQVIVSGMCTADFSGVEKETGVPVFLGPRHASDLAMILPGVGQIQLSRTIPADDLIAGMKRERALERLAEIEEEADPAFLIRGQKIGGGSRMKVCAEIMDAHRHPDLRVAVAGLFASGADIVDLGFGFDAALEDLRRVFYELEGIDGPLAVDTQDPDLIRAALERADLILSLQEANIPIIGSAVADAGVAAVIVPGEAGLTANIAAAEACGISCLIRSPPPPCRFGAHQGTCRVCFGRYRSPPLLRCRKCGRTPGCGFPGGKRPPRGDGKGGWCRSHLLKRALGQDEGVGSGDAAGHDDDGTDG